MHEADIVVMPVLHLHHVRSHSCLGWCRQRPVERHDIASAAVPDVLDETGEFFPVLLQVEPVHRFVSDNQHACLCGLGYAPQHRHGYGAHFVVDIQRAVGHSGGSDQFAVLRTEGVGQCGRVYEIKCITFRNLRAGELETGCDIGVLAVEISDVGHEPALLKHMAAAAEVVGPCARFRSPGLLSRKPLTIRAKAHTRHKIVLRLVRRAVYYEAVQSARHSRIGITLQVAGTAAQCLHIPASPVGE